MPLDGDSTSKSREAAQDTELTLGQLRGYQHGIAAVIMPVTGGWRVHYYSIPSFDGEPGTTFPSYDAAMSAIDEVLPVVNSPDERNRATQELRDRLRQATGDSPERDTPQDRSSGG